MSEDLCPDIPLITKEESCRHCMEGNMLFPIFFFTSFVPFTILLSSWIVAKFVYIPHLESIKNEILESSDEEEEEILYEDKYPIDEEHVNKDFQADDNYVCESTPDGLVFLKYSKRDEGFNWWSDNQHVAYKYLETVARRYVKAYHCTNLYIDRKKELQKQIDREKEKEEKEKMESEDKKEGAEDSDEDLFVKFKPSEKIKPKKDKNKASVRGNKYKYYGKISDFKMIKKIIKKKESKKKIDFSAWKNMLKG
tara:strand:+ start:1359 stop:2114 length:756 start_codon:yes stop_codon:yes gene_type:complete